MTILFPVTPAKLKELVEQMKSVGLKECDIEEHFVRSSGPGGQKTNKTSSCVVLVHKPTQLRVKCQVDRSQALNRFLARRMLCEHLAKSMNKGISAPPSKDEATAIRKRKSRARRRTLKKKIKSKDHLV